MGAGEQAGQVCWQRGWVPIAMGRQLPHACRLGPPLCSWHATLSSAGCAGFHAPPPCPPVCPLLCCAAEAEAASGNTVASAATAAITVLAVVGVLVGGAATAFYFFGS